MISGILLISALASCTIRPINHDDDEIPIGAPDCPSGLAITSSTDTSLSISWNPSANAVDYDLFRSVSETGPYSTLANVKSPNTDFVDSPLAAATTYYYKIDAKNAYGQSTLSNYVAGTTKSPSGTVPQIPSGLAICSLTITSLVVSWNSVENTDGYQLYRSLSADGSYSLVAEVDPSCTKYIDTLVDAGLPYYYKIAAFNSHGSSGLSQYISGTGLTRDYWPTIEWQMASPGSHGMNSEKLIELVSYVQDQLPHTTSMLIVRHGYIVLEYYALNDIEQHRYVWSITKSVLSALIGIAVEKGKIQSIDQQIIDFFPEYTNDDIDPEARNITIRHLLDMSSGIAKDQTSSDINMALFMGPLSSAPGTVFFYNNLGVDLLSMILTKKTGLTALDFGKINLFSPLGISYTNWPSRQIQGVTYSLGGYGLEMTTRDLAKFGYLYLNNGMWDSEPVISSDWVQTSTKQQIDVPASSWYFIDNYGYLWWIRSIANHASYTALGAGGQYIYIIPDLDIVTVITTSDSPEREYLYLPIIDNYVVPSVAL